jgi:L-rhamnose mutarotase
MPRYAFKLRIKADAIEEYDREHKRFWPELLAKLGFPTTPCSAAVRI